MTHSEALKLALDALGKFSIGYHVDAVELNDLIATLESALERPEQDVPETDCGNMEPLAWLESPYGSIRMNTTMRFQFPPQSLKWKIPLYTHPPRREWRGLEDYEIDIETAESRDALMDFVYEHGTVSEGQQRFIRKMARAIEAALKERNA